MSLMLLLNLAVVVNGVTATEQQNDNSCGPRAVSKVLTHYRLACDMEQLVASLQNGDPMQPCSVSDVATCLMNLGIGVKVIESNANSFSWPYPVIVLHKPQGSPVEHVGHFLAVLPQQEYGYNVPIRGEVVAIMTAPSSRQLMIHWEFRHGQFMLFTAASLSGLSLFGVLVDVRRRVDSVTSIVSRKV